VKNFQPFYTFNPRCVEDLRIGTAILKEFMDHEREKAERAARSTVDHKAITATITKQVTRILLHIIRTFLKDLV
jgi:hypothetical protein